MRLWTRLAGRVLGQRRLLTAAEVSKEVPVSSQWPVRRRRRCCMPGRRNDGFIDRWLHGRLVFVRSLASVFIHYGRLSVNQATEHTVYVTEVCASVKHSQQVIHSSNVTSVSPSRE